MSKHCLPPACGKNIQIVGFFNTSTLDRELPKLGTIIAQLVEPYRSHHPNWSKRLVPKAVEVLWKSGKSFLKTQKFQTL